MRPVGILFFVFLFLASHAHLSSKVGVRGNIRFGRLVEAVDGGDVFSPTLRRGSRCVFPWGVWGGPPGTWPRPRAERRRKPAEDRQKTAPFRQTRFRAARAAPRWSARWSKRATSRQQVDPGCPRWLPHTPRSHEAAPGGPGKAPDRAPRVKIVHASRIPTSPS